MLKNSKITQYEDIINTLKYQIHLKHIKLNIRMPSNQNIELY
jgi:hypothetical protein